MTRDQTKDFLGSDLLPYLMLESFSACTMTKVPKEGEVNSLECHIESFVTRSTCCFTACHLPYLCVLWEIATIRSS